jgi:hypothetical protein
MRDAAFCFWHSPDTADELEEARRTGGYHRRKKRTVATVYGFAGLRTIEDNLALLETLAIETLALENSISRNTAATRIVATASRLLEVREVERRLDALESLQASRSEDDEVEAFAEET